MRFRLRTLLLQFSIRDVLWLMLVAAMAAGWYKDRTSLAQRVASRVAALDAEKAQVMTWRVRLGDMLANTQATSNAIDVNNKEMAARSIAREGYNLGLPPIYFLGPTSSSTKTAQELEDENKELRLKNREQERIIAQQQQELLQREPITDAK